MNGNEIEALLDQLQNGDVATADRVFREYEPLLRRAVRRRMPSRIQSRFDSADVIQSAWASILSGLRDGRWRFRDADHLRAFLMRVVLYRFYDRARTALDQTKKEEPLTECGHARAESEPRPSERAVADDVWEQLLAACPPEHLAVLHARRVGESCEEIAARSGLHPGSIRRILRRLARRVAFPESTVRFTAPEIP